MGARLTSDQLLRRAAEVIDRLQIENQTMKARLDETNNLRGAITKALDRAPNPNLLARDRSAVTKDHRPAVEHEITASARKRRAELLAHPPETPIQRKRRELTEDA